MFLSYLLAQMQDFSKSIHHNRILVDLTALQAMLLDQQGAEPAALGKLTEALALAQAGGFIQTGTTMPYFMKYNHIKH